MNKKNKRSLNINETVLVTIVRLLDGFFGLALFWLLMHTGMTEPDLLEIYKEGLIIFVFILVFFHFHNIYRSFRFASLRYEIHKIFAACFSLFIVLLLLGYIIGMLSHLPRMHTLLWMVLWPVSLVLMRIFLRKLLRSIRVKGYNLKKAVIVGQSRAGMNLAEHIHNNPWTGTQILGFFNDKGEENNGDNDISIKGLPYLGDIDALIRYIENHEIDIIYVALNGNNEPSMLKLVKAVENIPISIHYVPNVLDDGKFKPLRITHRDNMRDGRYIVLYGALGGPENPYKGWGDFVEGIERLPECLKDRIRVVLFGHPFTQKQLIRA